MNSVRDLCLPGFAFAQWYDRVDSTMTIARTSTALLPRGSDVCGVIAATEQTAGRGRQGRAWASSAGALMATFLFTVDDPRVQLSGYSLCVGVSIARALEKLDAPVWLKWPNDLMGRHAGELCKLGGILMEVNEEPGRRVLLIGIGINLSAAPSGVSRSASLYQVHGVKLDLVDTLTLIGTELRAGHASFIHSIDGFAPFRDEWNELSCFSEGTISIELGGEVCTGVYRGVAASGALLVESAGRIREIHAGHVVSWPTN